MKRAPAVQRTAMPSLLAKAPPPPPPVVPRCDHPGCTAVMGCFGFGCLPGLQARHYCAEHVPADLKRAR